MNRRTQKAFVRELMGSITKDILSKSGRWPEEWDGHELRALVRDTAAQAVMGIMGEKFRGNVRRKAYEQECVNRCLP